MISHHNFTFDENFTAQTYPSNLGWVYELLCIRCVLFVTHRKKKQINKHRKKKQKIINNQIRAIAFLCISREPFLIPASYHFRSKLQSMELVSMRQSFDTNRRTTQIFITNSYTHTEGESEEEKIIFILYCF